MLIAVITIVTVGIVTSSCIVQLRLYESDPVPALTFEATALSMQLRSFLEAGGSSGAGDWLEAQKGLRKFGLVTMVDSAGGGLQEVLIPLARIGVADRHGRLLASMPAAPGTSLDPWIAGTAATALGLGGDSRHPESKAAAASDGNTAWVLAPILGEDGDRLGSLYLEAAVGSLDIATVGRRIAWMVPNALRQSAPSALLIALVLGALSTRGLVRRLASIEAACAAWSKGDFRVRVNDSSPDEIGQLARSFNEMSSQIQRLIDAREDLAVLQERNRLAGELHDSVKQRMFSIAMLLKSAEMRLRPQPEKSLAHLEEAREIGQQVSRELVEIIEQLRPEKAERQPLDDSLRSYCASWSRAQGIPSSVEIEAHEPLGSGVERDLLRIAQEALANVGRHSKACHVELELAIVRGEGTGDHGRVHLSVRDDGVGFDVDRAHHAGFGLESMRSRMARRGGGLEIRSRLGAGTRVEASCPVDRLSH